jgi:hypothetical protein
MVVACRERRLPMKVLFTVELSNRHVQEVDLLDAYIRDALANFNTHTLAAAKVSSVHLLSNESDDGMRPSKGARGEPT